MLQFISKDHGQEMKGIVSHHILGGANGFHITIILKQQRSVMT